MTKTVEANVDNKTVLTEWSPEEVELIRETVARGATMDELKLFLYTAKARGLNPLLKQIYFIKRKQKRGDRWVEVGVIQTGIEGFRLIANRTRKLKGIERGIQRDDHGRLSAWARVWRKDWENPAYEEVSLDEYKGDSPLWNRMPEQMLKKCAEAAALRMAFPEALSGLYSHDEMDQADVPPPVARATAPVAAAAAEFVPEAKPDESVKRQQVAMRDCLKAITRLQKDYDLSKEAIQEITGLETFRGADLETLEAAVEAMIAHCQTLKAPVEVS